MVPVAEAMTRCISSTRGIEDDDDDDDDDGAAVALPLLAVVVVVLVVDTLLLFPVAVAVVAFFFAAAVVFPFFPFLVASTVTGGSSLGVAPSDTSIPTPCTTSAILLSDVTSLSLPLIPTCHQEQEK